MNKVRFRSGDNKEKVFAGEVRKRVDDYFKNNKISMKGDYRMYLKSIVMLGIYLIPFILILTVSIPPLLALGLAIIIGIGAAGIGMSVMHDGAHGAYSAKAGVNKFVASSMYLLGSNTFNWKIQHNINHHTFTNMYDFDPDISTKAVIRLSEHAPLKKYHRFQYIYSFFLYGLMTFARFFGDVGVLLKHIRNGVTEQNKVNSKVELVKLVLTKVLYLGIIIGLPLWLTEFNVFQVLLGFIVIHLTAGVIMTTVFQMAHVVEGTYQPLPDENNEIQSDWLVHQMRTTSDFGRNNGLLSWYIGGLDFQVEHHLFPNICHIHYPAIAPIVESTAKEFGFQYNLEPTIFRALVSHARRLKELGTLTIQPTK